MPCANDLHGQIQLVCQYFHSRVGLTLLRYETGMLRDAQNSYRSWHEAGIWLHLGPGEPVMVRWSVIELLVVDFDEPLPPWDESANPDFGSVVNALPELNPLCGCALRAVYLDATDDHWEGASLVLRRPRLLLEFDRGWLEVFNALQENGYTTHATRPDGEWIRCA